MAQERSPASGSLSRRELLFVGAIGGGAILATGLTASRAEAAKMSQKAMSYKTTPNGTQRCDNCANFQPPSGCKLVDGTIAPSGWCILYRTK